MPEYEKKVWRSKGGITLQPDCTAALAISNAPATAPALAPAPAVAPAPAPARYSQLLLLEAVHILRHCVKGGGFFCQNVTIMEFFMVGQYNNMKL